MRFRSACARARCLRRPPSCCGARRRMLFTSRSGARSCPMCSSCCTRLRASTRHEVMISAFDLFKIGIGPSSSHTVGPMRAAAAFIDALRAAGEITRVERIGVVLFGSLAWTGRGHGSDRAVIAGLHGERPDTVDPSSLEPRLQRAIAERWILLDGRRIGFDPRTDLVFDTATPATVHPNTMCFTASDALGAVLLQQRWCSVGGGFIALESEVGTAVADAGTVPLPFGTAAGLLEVAERTGLTIAAVILRNEQSLRPLAEIEAHLDRVAAAMMACIDRGMASPGELPGGLKVRRRAAALYERLRNAKGRAAHEIMDYVSL